VVKLKDFFPHGTGFVLVFDFMLSDLSEVIRNYQRPLTPAQVKCYMMMLLKGVAFLHHNNIMHRVVPSSRVAVWSSEIRRGSGPVSAGNADTGQLACKRHTSPEDTTLESFNVEIKEETSIDSSSEGISSEIVELPDYNKITFKENPAIPLEEIVPDTSSQAIDLLYKLHQPPSAWRFSGKSFVLMYVMSSHRLDDVSCQSVSSSYSPPPLYYFFGHHTLTPPRNFLHPSPPGFCGSSSSSSDWCDPEQRECASCGTNSALLWRRDAAGKHLCYTCSLGQENGNSNQNEPLLRPKRRAVSTRTQ
ncbi:hypothetical protein XENOCAPTIV_010615, partial [Xenoophorus captivus]